MSGLTRLSDILPDAAGKSIGTYVAVNRAWAECAGDTIAFMTSPSRMEGGVLNIAVHDQSWLSELNFMKGELTEAIREKLPEVQSLSFYFRLRKQKPQPKTYKHKQMTEKERSFADRLANTLSDQVLRESFRRAIYSYFTVYSLDDYLSH